MSTTNPTHVLTEWEELQIKHGNYAERPAPVTEANLSGMAVDFAETVDPLEKKSLAALDKLEDDVDEDELQSYRRKRLEELKRAQEACKFGEVVHIGKAEYVAEVTDASADGQPVVLLLYINSCPTCAQMCAAWKAAAGRLRSVKFCLALGPDIVEKFPHRRAPTVLLYKDRQCVRQWVGGSIWGGLNASADTVEWVLAKQGKVIATSLERDPRKADDEDDDEEEKPRRGKKSTLDYRSDRSDSDEDSDEERGGERVLDDGRGYSSLALERNLRTK